VASRRPWRQSCCRDRLATRFRFIEAPARPTRTFPPPTYSPSVRRKPAGLPVPKSGWHAALKAPGCRSPRQGITYPAAFLFFALRFSNDAPGVLPAVHVVQTRALGAPFTPLLGAPAIPFRANRAVHPIQVPDANGIRTNTNLDHATHPGRSSIPYPRTRTALVLLRRDVQPPPAARSMQVSLEHSQPSPLLPQWQVQHSTSASCSP
jgi:hypothetical protein